MRDILENLYFGNITPNEQGITPGSVLADAMDRAEQCEERLTTLLEGEEKTLLLRLRFLTGDENRYRVPGRGRRQSDYKPREEG